VLFRVISGYFVSSSKNRIKRVISGYSHESCYFAYFGPFRVISGYLGFFAQKRIRVGPLASLALALVVLRDYLRKFRFFRILVFFQFSVIFRILAASENVQVASKQ